MTPRCHLDDERETGLGGSSLFSPHREWIFCWDNKSLKQSLTPHVGSCCYPLPLIPREETSQVSNGKGIVVFKCTVLFSSGFIVISPAEQQGYQSVYCQSGMCKQEQSLLPVMENIKYTMWKLIKKKKKGPGWFTMEAEHAEVEGCSPIAKSKAGLNIRCAEPWERAYPQRAWDSEL